MELRKAICEHVLKVKLRQMCIDVGLQARYTVYLFQQEATPEMSHRHTPEIAGAFADALEDPRRLIIINHKAVAD